MKRYFSLVVLTAFVLCGFNSCEESTSSGIATYYGTVIDENTDLPFEGVDVKVTDGDRIHTSTQTNSDGYFSVEVRMQEVNQDYYILFGNSLIGTKRVEFPSFGNGRYDLGIITIKGPSTPTVETIEVSNIKSNTAKGGGKVTSSGGFAVTKRGVCWSTTQYPSISNDHSEDGIGVGEFISNINKIKPNTTYYVRAYAENEKGVAYGNQVTFMSASGVLPTVTTTLVQVNSKTEVFCEGKVTNEGDSHVIARGICWGTSTPTISNQKTNDGERTGAFSTSVTVTNVHLQDLYFRAYATNESGTAYGEAIKIDHRNPYNLYKVSYSNVSYLVLPYDLERGYMGSKDLSSSDNTAYISCQELVAYDYDDWQLPTVPLLELIYKYKDEIGGFTSYRYWTSERGYHYKYGIYYYYCVDFATGKTVSDYGTHCVRPVRQY